jgi:hypothetical protein
MIHVLKRSARGEINLPVSPPLRRFIARKCAGASKETRHCQERSDEAIQSASRGAGLLRFARNDE